VWARALAVTLPHTTAAMLELDFLHRAKSPLEPRLRGQMRWVAARTNGCRYSEAYAAADLRRIGVEESAIQQLAGDLRDLPADTRAVLQFARKLSCDGASVSDEEVAQLISRHGERQVVAMVLLLAYASFQDRLVLALGLSLESGEPLPPLDVRFAQLPLGASRAAPPRQRPRGSTAKATAKTMIDVEWRGLDFQDIQTKLASQRARCGRISLPSDNQQAPRWGLVCQVYQPKLAAAWSACAHAFSDEANQDPIFEESVFWVVTRTIQCFY
jgi:alkylhydroperoxidase family enzyme